MFEKIVDVLKEVFWLKKPAKQRKSAGHRKKTAKKTVRKPKARPKPAPVPKPPAKRVVVKSTPKPKPLKPPKVLKTVIDPSLVPVGEITHYFDRIKVGVVKINQGTILIGDRLTIAAKPSPFFQKVWSMQIESQDVKVAKKGQLIGLKIDKPVSVGDIVYK